MKKSLVLVFVVTMIIIIISFSIRVYWSVDYSDETNHEQTIGW
jgi:hypothetical protein